MNILIAFPSQNFKDNFISNENFIFLDEKGIWKYNKETSKRECTDLINIEIDFSQFNIKTREELYWWSPIWTRWISGSFNYEQIRLNALDIILKLKTCLKSNNISLTIFFTGIPHHLDTSLLSIACSNLEIPKIFLYSNVIDGRLLPLIENKTIFDRKQLGKEVSKIDYEILLDDFLSNRLEGNPPKLNTKPNLYKTNYYYVVLKTITYFFRKNIVKILKKSDHFLWTDFNADISILDAINLINIQKKYLNKYNKLKLNLEQSNNFINSTNNKIIMAAHYQPEATTFPEGGEFSNHIEIVYKLRNLGYNGEIGYKEHPATKIYFDDFVGLTRVGIYRTVEYIKQLEKANCVFLSDDANLEISLDKIYNYIPVTITGTIAIERSLAGLHTIVVGKPWFIGMPGIIHIDQLITLNEVESTWVSPSANIAKSAKLYLMNLLNNKTIQNVPGIGTGKPISDNLIIQEFNIEFMNLINNLIN
jgi:hypothetical protein